VGTFAISFGSFALGVLCLVVGATQMYPPAGWIVLGLALVLVALVPRMRHP
jgi:hypothetical protein